MDPDACFCLILDSIVEDDWTAAADHADDLRNWLSKGGFPPGGGKLRRSSIDGMLDWLISQSSRHS